ncbi:MAG: hypothetical protein WBA12_09665, partial [Catalinimonas sp.]
MQRLLSLCGLLLCLVPAWAQDYELVADINRDASRWSMFRSEPFSLTPFKGDLYFTAEAPGVGRELYRYGGTEHALVVDLYPGTDANGNANDGIFNYAELAAVHDRLYFIGKDGTRGDTVQLYAYDGQGTPTVVMSLGEPPSDPDNYSYLAATDDELYVMKRTSENFTAELWVYDGVTEPRRVPKGDDLDGAYFYRMEAVGNTVYLFKFDSNHKVWTYDGSGDPIAVPAFDRYAGVHSLVAYDGEIFFGARDTDDPDYQVLPADFYAYADGTVRRVLAGLNPGGNARASAGAYVHDDTLYFSANDGTTGDELWRYDGTAVSQVADLNPGDSLASSHVRHFVSHRGDLYFTAEDSTHGRQFWKYVAGSAPRRLTDGNFRFLRRAPVPYGDYLYFPHDAGTVAEELYRLEDGEARLRANIYDGSAGSVIQRLFAFGGKMYFDAFGQNGRELHVWDGTDVREVADLHPGEDASGNGRSSNPQLVVALDDRFLFRAQDSTGQHLWSYDGTGVPTRDTTLPTSARGFVTHEGQHYFTAYDTAYGSELWRWDGTNAPTRITDINPGASSSYPSGLTSFGGKLYFSALDDADEMDNELWVWDGSGATRVADHYEGAEGSWPAELTVFQDHLYFTAYDTLVGYELYRHDGTGGIELVADLYPGRSDDWANDSYPNTFRVVDDTLYFLATDASRGTALWKYDGTNPPAVAADVDITGRNGPDFRSPAVVDSLLYFWANEQTGLGNELYYYNTRNGRLTMVPELRVGPAGSRPSTPSNLLSYDGYLYLSAADGVTGWLLTGELYRIDLGRVTSAP